MSEKALASSKNVKQKPPFSKAVFEQKNQRRHALIQKQSASELTPAEVEELECLEVETTAYLDVAAPLPLDLLEQIKAVLNTQTS